MPLANGTLEEFGYSWLSNPKNGGGDYVAGYPWRIALHETDTSSMSAGAIMGHPYPPHIWANPFTHEKFQTVPCNRAAYALYQPPYGYAWVNKANALQCEITGFAGYTPDETDAQLHWIAENVVVPLVLFVRSQGSDVALMTDLRPPNYSMSASVDWPYRMTEDAWAGCNYVTSHVFVWGNDHWDVGAMRTDLICTYAAQDPRLGGGGPIHVATYALVDDRIDVVGTNAQGHIYHKWYEGQKWQPGKAEDGGGWEHLTAGLGNEALAAGPPVCEWFGEQFQVFYPRRDGKAGQIFIGPGTNGWVVGSLNGGVNGVGVATRTKLVQTS